MNKLIIVDLEATCWSEREETPDRLEGCRYTSETIEIGAVSLDLENWEKSEEFQSFVKPRYNPMLSDFCTELTTIEQSDVDPASAFPEVIRSFEEFVDFRDEGDVWWGSWGDYDRKQIIDDYIKHQLPVPEWVNRHINLKKVVGGIVGLSKNRRVSISKVLNSLDLQRSGTHHRGIDDAMTYVNVLLKLKEKYGEGAMLENLKASTQ